MRNTDNNYASDYGFETVSYLVNMKVNLFRDVVDFINYNLSETQITRMDTTQYSQFTCLLRDLELSTPTQPRSPICDKLSIMGSRQQIGLYVIEMLSNKIPLVEHFVSNLRLYHICINNEFTIDDYEKSSEVCLTHLTKHQRKVFRTFMFKVLNYFELLEKIGRNGYRLPPVYIDSDSVYAEEFVKTILLVKSGSITTEYDSNNLQRELERSVRFSTDEDGDDWRLWSEFIKNCFGVNVSINLKDLSVDLGLEGYYKKITNRMKSASYLRKNFPMLKF